MSSDPASTVHDAPLVLRWRLADAPVRIQQDVWKGPSRDRPFSSFDRRRVLKHLELHASEAYGEDRAQWSEEVAQMVKDLIRPTA
jgi:hypothetical protein